jgi:hypothetical protein
MPYPKPMMKYPAITVAYSDDVATTVEPSAIRRNAILSADLLPILSTKYPDMTETAIEPINMELVIRPISADVRR